MHRQSSLQNLVPAHRARNVVVQGKRVQRNSHEQFVTRKMRLCRLYERDPFTNKPTKHQLNLEQATLAPANTTNATLLMSSTTPVGHLQPHSHAYNSIIFPDHTVSSLSDECIQNGTKRSSRLSRRRSRSRMVHFFNSISTHIHRY